MGFRNILKEIYIFFTEKGYERRKRKKKITLRRKVTFWQSTKGTAGIHTANLYKCEPCHLPETLWRWCWFLCTHVCLPKKSRVPFNTR